MKHKILRITTVPISFKDLLKDQLNYIQKNGFDPVMVSSSGKEVSAIIENEKCPHIEISLTRVISPLKDLNACIKLYRIIKKERPLIVHSHTPKAGIVAMTASYFARTPIRLHTVAGMPLMEAQGLKKLILLFVEKLTYKFSTKIYPNSFGLLDYILNKELAANSKLKVIGEGSSNGIDTSYFNPKHISETQRLNLKNELKIKKDDLVFIFIGRIVSHKGINELIEAFNLISCEYKYIKLILVGSFENDLDPIKIVTKEIINNNEYIIHVGYQNDIRNYLSISDVLVFPSYREGFPNVVMQAGSMNIPCIVSDINGCNEIIKNNINGLIIPSKDSKALYQVMKKIAIDKNEINHLKTNCRKIIKQKFERKIIWEKLLEEYNNNIGLINKYNEEKNNNNWWRRTC